MEIAIEITDAELNGLRAYYERWKWLVTLRGEFFSTAGQGGQEDSGSGSRGVGYGLEAALLPLRLRYGDSPEYGALVARLVEAVREVRSLGEEMSGDR